MLWNFFVCYPPMHVDNFLHTLTWDGVYFFILTVWHGLYSLVFTFSGLRIGALLLSSVQGKCIYNIFKAENQETQFQLCTKPSIDKHNFHLSRIGSPDADLSAIHALLLLLLLLTYLYSALVYCLNSQNMHSGNSEAEWSIRFIVCS